MEGTESARGGGGEGVGRAGQGSAGRGGGKRSAGRKKKGVPVRLDEVKAAFAFLDTGDKGYVTKHDLQEKLPLFYKNLKPKEYAYLMNKKSRITVDELYAMLSENELTHYDPVEEAFQFYDPQGTGYIDGHVLRTLLTHIGLGTVTDEDLATRLSASDRDGDGLIGLEDFRRLLDDTADRLGALDLASEADDGGERRGESSSSS